MKGIFTQIKYNAQGVIMREAANTGMVVGLPIVTEHKKLLIPASGNVELADGDNDYVPEISIAGDDPVLNYVDGDKLAAMRMWIRKANENISEAHELKGADFVLNKTDYGNGENDVVTIKPIKRIIKDSDSVEASWSDDNEELTLDSAIENLAAGQTIVATVTGSPDEYHYGVVTGQPLVDAGETVCSVAWSPSPEGGFTGAPIEVYYDYTSNPVTENERGYALHFDMTVYRTSIYGVKTISSIDDLVSMFGNDALTNPASNLACGAFLYGSAAGWRDKFKICALDLRDTDNIEDTAVDNLLAAMSSWQSSLQKHVDIHKDAYYLVPLTMVDAVHDASIAYVDNASSITRRREKRLYVAKQITGVADEVTDMDDQFGNGKWGDLDYTAGRLYQDGYLEEGTLKTFDVDTDVETALSVAMPVNNERVTYIGCEHATIGDVNFEGYYVAAIVAGWRSSMPIGYDASDMKVPLLSSVANAISYYSDDHYDSLAASGWYMIKQSMVGAPVECYIQKTTAYDSVEKGEESFIVALDYCMRDIRATLAPYVRGGLDNRVSGSNPDSPVTVRYLNKLNSALSMIRYKYVEDLEVFAAMEVVAVRVSAMKRTAAEIDVKFNHYYPVREITVTGYVE